MANYIAMPHTRRPVHYFPFLLALAFLCLDCGDLSAGLLDKLKKQLGGDDQQESYSTATKSVRV